MLSPGQINPTQIEWIRGIVHEEIRDYSAFVGFDVGPDCPEVRERVAVRVQGLGSTWRARIEASMVGLSPA